MSDETTRDKILNAASDVFCKKGFDNTTIRDICKAAGANVAAVNYHFGDKQKLYYKVLSKWMHEFVEERELREAMQAQTDAAGRLRVFIRSDLTNLCAYNDPTGTNLSRTRMLLREVASDQPAPEVFECHKELEEELLHPLIRELIGTHVDKKAFEQACIVATSATTHYFIMSIHDPTIRLKTEEDLEYMTDYLTAFVLGGLKAIREKYNA